MSEKKYVFIIQKQSGTQKYWSEGLTFTNDPNKAQRFIDEQHARELLQEAGDDFPSCKVIFLDEKDMSEKKELA